MNALLVWGPVRPMPAQNVAQYPNFCAGKEQKMSSTNRSLKNYTYERVVIFLSWVFFRRTKLIVDIRSVLKNIACEK